MKLQHHLIMETTMALSKAERSAAIKKGWKTRKKNAAATAKTPTKRSPAKKKAAKKK
jgi:hypothetical protein